MFAKVSIGGARFGDRVVGRDGTDVAGRSAVAESPLFLDSSGAVCVVVRWDDARDAPDLVLASKLAWPKPETAGVKEPPSSERHTGPGFASFGSRALVFNVNGQDTRTIGLDSFGWQVADWINGRLVGHVPPGTRAVVFNDKINRYDIRPDVFVSRECDAATFADVLNRHLLGIDLEEETFSVTDAELHRRERAQHATVQDTRVPQLQDVRRWIGEADMQIVEAMEVLDGVATVSGDREPQRLRNLVVLGHITNAFNQLEQAKKMILDFGKVESPRQ